MLGAGVGFGVGFGGAALGTGTLAFAGFGCVDFTGVEKLENAFDEEGLLARGYDVVLFAEFAEIGCVERIVQVCSFHSLHYRAERWCHILLLAFFVSCSFR